MKINDFEKYMQIKLGRVAGAPLTKQRAKQENKLRVWRQNGQK